MCKSELTEFFAELTELVPQNSVSSLFRNSALETIFCPFFSKTLKNLKKGCDGLFHTHKENLTEGGDNDRGSVDARFGTGPSERSCPPPPKKNSAKKDPKKRSETSPNNFKPLPGCLRISHRHVSKTLSAIYRSLWGLGGPNPERV